MGYNYKGIKFSKDLNVSLEDFKKMFASNRVFKAIPNKERDAELEKVWKSVKKHNGFDTRVSTDSEGDKPKRSKGKSSPVHKED